MSNPSDPRPQPPQTPQPPKNPPDPRYPQQAPPEVLSPRDPQGGVGSQLNPTRDHVQGEPEGTTPEANEHASQAPRTAEPAPKPAPKHEDEPKKSR
jgi:hypothetical protein